MTRDLVRVGGLIFSHLLTEPARRRLRQAAPTDLHLRLDEELIDVPWELCHDGDTFLGAKFRVGRQVITGRAIPKRAAIGRRATISDCSSSRTRPKTLGRAMAAAEQLCAELDGVPEMEVTLLGGRTPRGGSPCSRR